MISLLYVQFCAVQLKMSVMFITNFNITLVIDAFLTMCCMSCI